MVCACMCAQSCLTLCDFMDCSPPGSSVCGILQARVLQWVAVPFSRGSSWARNWTCISCVSCISRHNQCSFTTVPPGYPGKWDSRRENAMERNEGKWNLECGWEWGKFSVLKSLRRSHWGDNIWTRPEGLRGKDSGCLSGGGFRLKGQ